MSDDAKQGQGRHRGVLKIELLADKVTMAQWGGTETEPAHQTARLYHGDTCVCHVHIVWPTGMPTFGVIQFVEDPAAAGRHAGERD